VALVEDEVVSLVDEDKSSVVSVVLSSDFLLQDDSKNAMLISRTKQKNDIFIFFNKIFSKYNI
jgi:hypothetical protein